MTCQLVNKRCPLGGESSHHIQGQQRSATMDNPEKGARTVL